MVPAFWLRLERMPLTVNGKVDRHALPTLGARPRRAQPCRGAEKRHRAARRGDLREVLGIEDFGIHDNFFEVGANSLNLITIHNRLKQAFAQDIPLTALFEHTNIARLAELLGADPAAEQARLEQEAAELKRPDRRCSNQKADGRAGAGMNVQTTRNGLEIAVIGMAGRFPGATDLEAFWANLVGGKDRISSLSDEELRAAGVHPALMRQNNFVKRKGCSRTSSTSMPTSSNTPRAMRRSWTRRSARCTSASITRSKTPAMRPSAQGHDRSVRRRLR